ncbi:DUF4974 domain-containing protein [Maribellus luteus]|uniref:DUF4974 domain-containing protein n=1 Tax=Maribellus luteus TaxID=2305463 RepID=A0A399T2J4_9BACT|nr:FecR domain-containing protein [Maribellus luteus]RIJ49045.1 DUF4974 domain-containing protein [Maribellus luteus]
MEQRFLEYSTEQLLEEKDFIAWILNNKNDREWKVFLEQHPEFRNKVKEAREIIHLLADTHDELGEDALLSMWRDIDRHHQSRKKKSQKRELWSRLSWAASVLLVVSIGLGGYFYLIKKDAVYHFSSSLGSENPNGHMVLSSGEEIPLEQKHSAIRVNDTEKQVIVNDSIINLVELKRDQKKKTEMNEVVIPYGKSSELLLADGTKVWLNAGSRLAFPSSFSKDVREVYLEGEACFKVTRNEQRPFIVKTGDLDVRVLGTHFNVSAYPADKTIETVLLEGSVAVSQTKLLGLAKKEMVLTPDQKASFKKEQNTITVTSETNVDNYISWTYGWLKYSRESLSSVLHKVERYYNVKFQMPDNYPGDDKISGKLDLEKSLEDVMIVLGDASGFTYRISGSVVTIEKKIKPLSRK